MKKIILFLLAFSVTSASMAQVSPQESLQSADKVFRKVQLEQYISYGKELLAEDSMKLGILESINHNGLQAKFYQSSGVAVNVYLGTNLITWATLITLVKGSVFNKVVASIVLVFPSIVANIPVGYFVKSLHEKGHNYIASLSGKSEAELAIEYRIVASQQAQLVVRIAAMEKELSELAQ